MNNWLVNYALKDVWCAPRQDCQYVLAPSRVTPPSGDLNYTNLLGRTYKLPDGVQYYHVFQVGNLDPDFLTLLRQNPVWDTEKWYRFSDSVNKNGIEVTIYNEEGVVIPRSSCHYIYTEDRCLFFIVPNLKKIPVDFEKENIFFRFYRNVAFGQIVEGSTQGIEARTYTPMSQREIADYDLAMDTVTARPGYVRHYINGLYTNSFDLGNVKVGDVLEYVHDSSVKRVVRLALKDLYGFFSKLDNIYKYLLHIPGNNNFEIDYHTGIDFHLVYSKEGQFDRGLYYNRNYASNQRMVTHKDYAINAAMLDTLRQRLQKLLGLDNLEEENLYVELMFRKDASNRTLGFEAHRIRELYKLPAENIYHSLIGLNAVVPEWHCVNLEASQMVRMMDEEWTVIDKELVEKGYGYNAISKQLADTPLKIEVTGTTRIVKLGPALQYGSTIYEFNVKGNLLGWYYHPYGKEYSVVNPDTALVEAIVGEGTLTSDSIYGQNSIPITAGWDYRVYRCYLENDLPDNRWEDITDSSEYKVENGNVVYQGTIASHWLCVRSDRKFIAFDTEATIQGGLLNLVVQENPTGNPVDDLESVPIPFAQLDIWMNDFKLIRGLDYFVHWPRFIITNKTYLNSEDGVPQRFHVRASRLATKTLELDNIEEYGWIDHGTLSNNNIYDLRDDRVMQIVVGGLTKHRSDLVFAEDRPNPKLVDDLNGFPYQVKDLVIPFNDFTKSSAYDLRKVSMETDKRVSDYLTEYYGPMGPDGVSAIGSRWPVVSPFLSHLTYLLSEHAINLPADRLLTDAEVRGRCLQHEWLLNFDPLLAEHRPDIRYAFVVPHGFDSFIELDFVEYQFITKVIELYGYEGVVYKNYLAIKP